MHGAGDDTGPSRLMARSDAGGSIAVEVFMKLYAVLPVRIVLKFPLVAVRRTATVFVLQEHAGQTPCNLFGNLIQVHEASGAAGTLDGEVVAVISVVLQQSADYQRIDRHPNWSAPVRIATEHAGV